MRRYAQADEERVLLESQVRDWTRAGLLHSEQGAQLESDLKVTLRRTGRMLRIGLAVFTVIAAAAAIGFIVLLLDADSERSVAIFLLVAGAGCFVGADRLVVRFSLYRHGVEEALAVSAVALICLGLGLLISSFRYTSVVAVVAALAAGAIGGFELFRRFGLRYAAVAAMACAALIPLQLRLPAPMRILLGSAAFAIIFAIVRRLRRAHQNDLTGDEARTLEAVAILGTYLMLNLQVSGTLPGNEGTAVLVPWFKWTTYVLVWVLPPMTVWLGVRERERLLVDVGIVTALVTLMTNKMYLGMTTKPWDPVLFGIAVAGAAIVIRRWIASGPGEERGGFTSARTSAQEDDVIAALGTASTAFHPAPAPQSGTDQRPEFDGGRSGGAGGGADF
jgi:hypothetical protein